MMDLDGAYDALVKVRGNLTKQGKAITDDKTKADLLKRVDTMMGSLKTVIDNKKKLEKRMEDIKKLQTDIGTFNTQLGKVTSDARNLTKTAGDAAKSDTKTRDFFMMANFLQRVGQEANMDAP